MASEGTLRPRAPLLQQVADATPGGAWKKALVLGCGLLALFWICDVALGGIFAQAREPGNSRLAVIHIVVFSYLVGANLYLVERARREFRTLAVHEGPDWEVLGEPGRYPVGFRLAGAAGLAVGILGPYIGPTVGEPYDPKTWSNAILWHRLLSPLLGGLTALLAYRVLAESARLNDAARSWGPIDLFGLDFVSAFTRQGLLHGLLLAGTVGAFALFLTESGYRPLLVLLLASVVPCAALGLYAPVRGIHQRIQEARREALARCRAEWSRRVRAGDTGPPGTLADLAATEARIDAVPEWPFDGPTLRRFGLYLLIPLVSWSGGALAERLLDRLFD